MLAEKRIKRIKHQIALDQIAEEAENDEEQRSFDLEKANPEEPNAPHGVVVVEAAAKGPTKNRMAQVLARQLQLEDSKVKPNSTTTKKGNKGNKAAANKQNPRNRLQRNLLPRNPRDPRNPILPRLPRRTTRAMRLPRTRPSTRYHR